MNLTKSAEGIFLIAVVVILLGAVILFSIEPDTSYRDYDPNATIVPAYVLESIQP
ncbi:MAG: hypothetical protein GY832_34590 [Chloroflexi bacterium]|nr:hypothetical protein [Chloroflexota bacterium]